MRFNAYATRTESFDGLKVQLRTFGSSHRIDFPDGVLTITLPDEPDEHSSYEGYVDSPDDPEHSWYGVNRVALRLDLAAPIKFDGTEVEFNTGALFHSVGAKRADQIVERTLDEGFDRWKRTLRWIALAPGIGFDEVETRYSATVGRGYRIYRSTDDRLFHSHGGRVSSGGHNKVSYEAWANAQAAFDASEAPPVYFDFMHEAHLRLRAGQLRMAIVNAAIAAETAIRSAFRSTLPALNSSPAEHFLEMVAAQAILVRWPEITALPKRDIKSEGSSEVHALFDLRNEVMHEGLSDPERLETFAPLMPKVVRFILHADQVRRSNLKERDWINPAFGERERLTGQSSPKPTFDLHTIVN
ncbi:MAG: hypothetical protein ACKOPM_15910 [Novosphingobium sp.]